MAKDIFVRSAGDIEQMQGAYSAGMTSALTGMVRPADANTPIYNLIHHWAYEYTAVRADRDALKESIANLEEELAAANGRIDQYKTHDIGTLCEQATAWNAVTLALDEVSPGWGNLTQRGMDSACAAIRQLKMQVEVLKRETRPGEQEALYRAAKYQADAFMAIGQTLDELLPGWHNSAGPENAIVGGVACAAIRKLAEKDRPYVAISEMVDRFLGWKLPRDFLPDAGIYFNAPKEAQFWPIGTNLLTAIQAKAMFEHCLGIDVVTKQDKPAIGIHTYPQYVAVDFDDMHPPRHPGFNCAGKVVMPPEWPTEVKGDFKKPRKHNHYFRPFPFADIDIYRLLLVYEVTDPCAQHAIKKLLAMGKRGYKDAAKDVQDVIDTMTRWEELRDEEGKVSE